MTVNVDEGSLTLTLQHGVKVSMEIAVSVAVSQ